jgi:uncharacterized membrane protein YbhN (UPF0104 family)
VVSRTSLYLGPYPLSGISLGVLLLLLGLVLMSRYWAGRSLPDRGWIGRRVQVVAGALWSSLFSGKFLLRFLAASLVVLLAMGGVFELLFYSLGIFLTLQEVILFYALYRLTLHVMITPGNIGVRELAYGLLSEAIGIGMTEGVFVAALLRAFSYVILAVLGLSAGGLRAYRERHALGVEGP